MSTVRLAMTKNLDQVFTFLEDEYATMSRAEITKMALANLYNDSRSKYVEYLNDEQSKELEVALAEVRSGNTASFENMNDLIASLDS